MGYGSGGSGDVSQSVILELMTRGDFDGAVRQFERLRDAQGRFMADNAKVVAASKQAEDATYEVGNAYEVLEADLKRATTALEKEAAAAKWMARQAAELDDVLQKLAQHEKDAATASTAVAGAGDKAATATRKAGDAGGYGAMKWMLLGNAIQDAQYGFEAIVNNMPGIVMAFGGTAGVAGGIGIAAVAAQQLIKHLDSIKDLLGSETPQRLVVDLKGLQKVLDDIDAKPIKSKVDYSDYDIAKRKLDALAEAQAAFDNLRKQKSKDTIEAGKLATEAIVEYGGGDDFTSSADRVARAAAAVTKPDESEPSRVSREKRDEAQRQLETASDPDQILGLEAALKRYIEEYTKAQGEDYKNHLDVTRGKIGRASEGYSGDVDWLRKLVEANPQAFKAQGAGPGLLPGLMKAGRDQVADRAGAKDRQEVHANDRRYQEQADAEAARIDDVAIENEDLELKRKQDARKARRDARKKAVSGAVTAVGPGMDDQLEGDIWSGITRDKSTPEAMKAAVRGSVVRTLKGRGVADDIVGEVADAIIRKASDSAQNLILEGKQPKIYAQADAARNKAINDEVRRVKPGFDDSLEQALLRRVAGGQGIDQAAGALDAQLRGRLGSRGVSPDLRGDVSGEILRQVANKVANRVVMADNIPAAAGIAVAGLDAKGLKAGIHAQDTANAGAYAQEFQARTGATDRQAMEAGGKVAGLVARGADAEAAMQAVYASMSGHLNQVSQTMLRMLASQEQAMGVIGNATQALAQVQARQNQLNAKINMMSANQGRAQVQRGTRGLTFGGL